MPGLLLPLSLVGTLWSLLGIGLFVLALFLGSRLLPGAEQHGATLPDGGRVTYRLNGMWLMVIVLLVVAGGAPLGLSLRPLVSHFWDLLLAANLFSLGLTGVLYLRGAERDRHPLAGFWYGTELNPSWFGVDIKIFSYRPSLIGLALFNLAFAYAQFEQFGQLSLAMWLYQGFTLFYLLSSFQFEQGMLSMWDVIEERFGLMLVWGDYVLVPFFYCIPGYFLVSRGDPLSPGVAILLVALFVLGFWLFRGANEQKNRFKRDPQAKIWGRSAETLDGRLLISGFWGIGRKLNYSGEILVYLSWTLLTGVDSFWPYLLPLWLASLLTHRAWRDDRRCRAKYGELWERYCQRVKFRMVPFIY